MQEEQAEKCGYSLVEPDDMQDEHSYMPEDLSYKTKEQGYMDTMFTWQSVCHITQAAHLLR